MNFAKRLTRHPIPFETETGAAALAALPGLAPELRPLVFGAAGCSPFLAGVIEGEAAWVSEALTQAPEAALAAEFARLRALTPPDVAAGLRQGKRRVALLVGLADLGGVFALEAVTGALTELADLATAKALDVALRQELRRNKLPGMTEADLATGCGMAVLAMGKMGAGELNYSSDIDLICLFDETRYAPEAYQDARASLIRATRRMAAILNDITGDGYVFRTDLRLRPDPSVTPVCLSMDAAERYYESVGRTWERAAHIKARVCAGDMEAGAGYLARLTPFIWRKHLDFAAIEDAHDMRLRIRDHKKLGGALSLPGHNMKLGRGGIREIEFFTQTRQIIAGGRDPDLRSRETVPGLAALAQKGWIPETAATVLSRHYRAHREVEHRLQMLRDARTHDLPGTEEGFSRLACFMGESDVERLKSRLRHDLEEVHAVTESFFAPEHAGGENAGGENAGGGNAGSGSSGPELSEMAENVVSRWPNYPAMRTARAREIFARVRPAILERMQKAAVPDEALTQFDRFLAGLPAGVQLFSLFEANPQLIDLLVDICATAPALAEYLSRHAKVLDAVIGGSFFDPWPGTEALKHGIRTALEGAPDYEAKLDLARREMQEWHFRIGVHHLRGLISADEAGCEYAGLAEAVVAVLWDVVGAEFALKHGPAPGYGLLSGQVPASETGAGNETISTGDTTSDTTSGSGSASGSASGGGAMVLAMGSLGAGALNARSDLDILVIYDAKGVEESTGNAAGRRALSTRPYYARLTQAFVTALTAPMSEGRLYEVDMRLRPSGRQGPVATSVAAFENYQLGEAWTWEHMALTRARPVAGPPALMARVAAFRNTLIVAKSAAKTVRRDVAEMRARLAAAYPSGTGWNLKRGAGGLQDIELLAQMVALKSGSAATTTTAQLSQAAPLLSPEEITELLAARDLIWRLRMAERLLAAGPLNAEEIGEGGRKFLLRESQSVGIDAVKSLLALHKTRVAAIFDRVVGRTTSEDPV